jgi:hemoglobin
LTSNPISAPDRTEGRVAISHLSGGENEETDPVLVFHPGSIRRDRSFLRRAAAGFRPTTKDAVPAPRRIDALAAVTDDFVTRLATDPQLNRFFAGHNKEGVTRIRQHVIDFLCVATGGPCAYTGQDMKTAHSGLGITEADWDASVKHLVATLDKFHVPEKEKTEVLGAISPLKGDIVGH